MSVRADRLKENLSKLSDSCETAPKIANEKTGGGWGELRLPAPPVFYGSGSCGRFVQLDPSHPLHMIPLAYFNKL